MSGRAWRVLSSPPWRRAQALPRLLLAALVGLGLAAHPRAEEPETVNGRAFYPEGPLWRAGRLYYAEMTRDRILAWDGARSDLFWQLEGCGPTSLAPGPEGRFLVLCHTGHFLAWLSAKGETAALVERDLHDAPIRFPNDSAADGRGGIYLTASGSFDTDAPATGAVLYLPPGGRPIRVARGLRYPNGVAVSGDGRYLLVSEHLARRILRFRIGRDGGLDEGEVFAELDRLAPAPDGADPLAGPDGLELDRAGRLWIAEYGGGRVLALARDGRLLGVLPLPDRYTTNLAFDPGEEALYVTAPASNRVPPYVGRVYRLPRRLLDAATSD